MNLNWNKLTQHLWMLLILNSRSEGKPRGVGVFHQYEKNIHFFSEKVIFTLTLIWWKWYNCIVQSFGKDDKYQTLGLVFFWSSSDPK